MNLKAREWDCIESDNGRETRKICRVRGDPENEQAQGIPSPPEYGVRIADASVLPVKKKWKEASVPAWHVAKKLI